MTTNTTATAEGMISLKPAAKASELPELNWIKVGRDYVKGKEGQLVAKGKLVKIKQSDLYPNSPTFIIVDEEAGTGYTVSGNASIKEQLGQEGVIGLYVEVIFEGFQKSKTKGKSPFMQFHCRARAKA